jgi:hypothetical protein
MKSMQLNKVDVTTYLIKKRDNLNENELEKINEKTIVQLMRKLR